MKTQQELNIFKAPSIKALKALYYKSKTYIIEKSNLDNETAYLVRVSKKLIKSPAIRKSLKKTKKELNIFRKTTIETLKSAYYESTCIV
jgi:hypothetical protein